MLVSIPSQGREIDRRDGLRINLLKSLVESLLAGHSCYDLRHPIRWNQALAHDG
jgi:hypothetical protein